LNNRGVLVIIEPYYDRILTMTKGHAMFLTSHSSQPLARHQGLARFADWWPAALIGLVALLGAVPESNAQALLTLL
jgi:hypothetical protein